MCGPGQTAQITWRNSQGVVGFFLVPLFIVWYNMFMHAVDVFDQIRKLFGVDLTHATKEWTVRVFEILFSMVLAQAYNIYRFLHSAKDDLRKLSHTEFRVLFAVS